MPLSSARLMLAGLALCAAPSFAQAQTAAQRAAADKPSADLAKFCTNVVPSAEELRIAFQIERLSRMDVQVRQRLAELEKAEAQAREWVSRREALMKAGADSVVAIYAKMQPDTAASQMSAMDDAIAVAILGKLNPRAAGAILGQMEAERASKLSSTLSGAITPEERS